MINMTKKDIFLFFEMKNKLKHCTIISAVQFHHRNLVSRKSIPVSDTEDFENAAPSYWLFSFNV